MRRGLFLPKPSLLCLVPDTERPQRVQRSRWRAFLTHQEHIQLLLRELDQGRRKKRLHTALPFLPLLPAPPLHGRVKVCWEFTSGHKCQLSCLGSVWLGQVTWPLRPQFP